MLFRSHELPGIRDGEITVALRRWKRPTVRSGGTLITPIGVLAIDDIEQVADTDVSDDDARRAGFASAEDALANPLLRRDGDLYVVRFHTAGPDPRVALRDHRLMDTDELADVVTRLERLDRASRRGPWVASTLSVIRDRPGVRAADLAAAAGLETQRFKTDVRKLKALGLTESLDVGYRISPRGETVLSNLA